MWRLDGDRFVEITDRRTWQLDADVAAWLVDHGESVAPGDLATMRLGEIRPKLERVVSGRGATLLVPLLDRGTLIGIVEASHVDALREEERGFVAESARAAARGPVGVMERIEMRVGMRHQSEEAARGIAEPGDGVG